MQNGIATLENSLTISYKTKHTLTTQCSNHAPWCLPKGGEILCPHRNLHMDAYSGCIHNSQTWKKPRCPSISEQINKLWYIWTMEYYSSQKRYELSSREKTWRNLKCILLSERSQSEKATYCMIPTLEELTFWKRQNYGDNKKITSCQRWWGSGDKRWIGRT